jgi:hypothetical protein
VLAPERGSINFVASSHFGVVHYLDIWNSRAYTNISTVQYGATIGEIMKKTIDDVYSFTTTETFLPGRMRRKLFSTATLPFG